MATQKLALFTQHSRNWRDNRYVYPVISRRSKGLSVGVNLNPDKVCNFGCIYCCVDRTVAPTVRKVDLEILAAELDHMLALAADGAIFKDPPFDQAPPELQRINDIAFSGDGEPTSFPQFGEACRIAVQQLEKHGLKETKIVLITNATLLDRPKVKEALAFLDQHNGEIWAKLDAGTESYYRKIERTSIPLQRVLDNILDAGQARPIVVQSMFMRVEGNPPAEEEIEAYANRLRELKDGGCQIKLVQVYTVARGTAEKYVAPLPDAPLDQIAARVREAGLSVETYYGPT